jgi:L-cysteine:1D-myo-inositol 2-amino-2-deoxy-alpha-D-glucopyranoside ligase
MLPIANERGNHPEDPHKRDPLDFVLWQSQASGEPAWDSPWGPGRPGWHIECSTMATKYLGPSIDLHSGGADLNFPHHECEIAQLEPINGNLPFVKLWLHVAMVYHEGAKMSKSLGNLVMVRDLLSSYTPGALRLYLGGHHYRESWSHSQEALDLAQERAERIHASSKLEGGMEPPLDGGSIERSFFEAMDDDLNTPLAIETMMRFATDIEAAARNGQSIVNAKQALIRMGQVFGLQFGAGPESRVVSGWKGHLERFPFSLVRAE